MLYIHKLNKLTFIQKHTSTLGKINPAQNGRIAKVSETET